MIMEWRSEYPLFWYQYYYPPIWETEGSIALGQLLVNGEITPEEAAQPAGRQSPRSGDRIIHRSWRPIRNGSCLRKCSTSKH